MKEDSVQEIICKEICPYFGLDREDQSEKVVFMGSGREDVDVCFLNSIFLCHESWLCRNLTYSINLIISFFLSGSVLRTRLVKNNMINFLIDRFCE